MYDGGGATSKMRALGGRKQVGGGDWRVVGMRKVAKGCERGSRMKNMKVYGKGESYTCILAANKVVMINKSQEKGFLCMHSLYIHWRTKSME